MAKPRGSSKKYGKHSPLLVSAKKQQEELNTELERSLEALVAAEEKVTEVRHSLHLCGIQIAQASGLTVAQIAIMQRIRDTRDLQSYDFHRFQLDNLEFLQRLGYITGGQAWKSEPTEKYLWITPEGAETLRVCEIEMQAERVGEWSVNK